MIFFRKKMFNDESWNGEWLGHGKYFSMTGNRKNLFCSGREVIVLVFFMWSFHKTTFSVETFRAMTLDYLKLDIKRFTSNNETFRWPTKQRRPFFFIRARRITIELCLRPKDESRNSSLSLDGIKHLIHLAVGADEASTVLRATKHFICAAFFSQLSSLLNQT